MGGNAMNNGMSQQNGAVDQTINQAPLTKTIDGIYRQRVNNFSSYNQASANYFSDNSIKQENPISTPGPLNFNPINEGQSIDGIYRQSPNSYKDNIDSVRSMNAQEQPYIADNNIASQANNGYAPNYRNYRPKTYAQSVDGIRNTSLRPQQYNKYNQLPYQPAVQQNINPQFSNLAPPPQRQNYTHHNNLQTEVHIPVTTTPINKNNNHTQTKINNQARLDQPTIQDEKPIYATNNSIKTKNTTYLDVINTILLLSILSVTILILLNI